MAQQTRVGCRTCVQALSIPANTEPVVVNGFRGYDTGTTLRVFLLWRPIIGRQCR